MNTDRKSIKGITRCLAALVGWAALVALPVQAATIIDIVNPGFEDPVMDNELNTSFDGVHGNPGGVPGWSSNQSSSGGAIHVDQWFPGRTGNNVMYLHGSGAQNFYTSGFDLGVNLQSHTTYTLTFDVLRWYGWDGVTSITDEYVTFEAGLYTGADFDSRATLASISGNYYLEDSGGNPLSVATITLTYTTGTVVPGTEFWIGGSALGNALDAHRATFDNFQLTAEAVPEPSVIGLLIPGCVGLIALRRNRKEKRA